LLLNNKPVVGLTLGISAYFVWGFFPIFFKQLIEVSPLEILAHRIAWAALLLALLVTGRKQWSTLFGLFRNRKTLLRLLATAFLISTNWLVFIIAVDAGYILQSSLGYFISPLVTILLARLLLAERLRPWQKISVALAIAGVLCQVLVVGQFPWIALILAASFGFYGLLRKTESFDALTGLAGETILMAPLALIYLGWLAFGNNMIFLHGETRFDLLLPISGLVTITPLLLFSAATRRLRLSSVGFLQYITPTMHFLFAVFLYREPFSGANMFSFILIWCALAIYSVDTTRSIHLANSSTQLSA